MEKTENSRVPCPPPEVFGRNFRPLKVVCDKIARNPSRKENATELSQTIDQVENFVLQGLQNYLLVPPIVHLSNKKNNKKDTVISVLECLRVLLERFEVSEASTFWEIFVITWLQIRNSQDPTQMDDCPEEMKLLVVECVQLLIKNAAPTLLNTIYTREYQPKFSLAVYTCVQMAKTEKCVPLRVESLKCIEVMLQLNCADTELRERVADVAMLMLPGIVSCCGHIVSSSDTQNHKVIVEAIRLWGDTVSVILEDVTPLKRDNSTFKLAAAPINDSRPEFKYSKNHRRDDANWLRTTTLNLVPITASIVGRAYGHGHWAVRRELTIQIHRVLLRASNNMTPSLRLLLDALIILSQDGDTKIASQSAAALKAFALKCDRQAAGQTLAEIVEDCFYSLLTNAPRIFHGADLDLKEKQLILLSGYLDLLGSDNLAIVLRSQNHLSRLLHCLYIASTLDSSDVILLAEHAIRDIDDGMDSTGCPWKKLKLCSTSKSEKALTDICVKLLSQNMNVVNSLLDDFDCVPHHRKEILSLLDRFLVEAKPSTCKEYESLLKQVLISVMEPSLWRSPTEVGSLCTDLQEAQSNVVLICLLSEIIGSLACALGSDTFAPLLLRCLYPVLECAGSPLYIVSCAGLKSVQRIAALYGGGGVSDLVAANVDYLSYHVTKNLKHAHTNPRVLAVLSVIMKHSNLDTLPSIHEIVNDVLVRSCDTFQSINVNSFLSVFLTFFNSLVNWIKVKLSPAKRSTPPRPSIVDELIEYDRCLIEASSDVTGSVEDSPQDDEELVKEAENAVNQGDTDEYDDKAPIPDYVNLTVQILERTLHFLPSKVRSRQILVLQILEKGAVILSKWTNQLLPLVHKMWSPLVERFTASNDPLIVRRAFELLQVLGRTSKDFIRVRTLKEALPSLCRFLQNEQIALSPTSRPGRGDLKHFKMSQTYKCLTQILTGLPQLCIDLDVVGEPLGRIVECIVPYLSEFEPQSLQDVAMTAVETMASIDADLVWGYLLSECLEEQELIPTSGACRSYRLAAREDNFKDRRKLKNNINILLNKI